MNKPEITDETKINKLLKISPWIFKRKVISFIKKNPDLLRELVSKVQEIGSLNDKQFMATLFLTLLHGGSCITGLK